MDELEVLKKQWQEGEQEFPTLSYDEIYKMLLKKSSSMVKWIFFISIAEIVFWIGLAFLVPESSKEINDQMGLHDTFIVVNILNYAIFIFFIILFGINYRRISVTDSVKILMKNILRTRRTVRYFVIYNVSATALALIAINLYYYSKRDQLYVLMVENFEGYSSIPQEQFATIFFGAQIIFGIIMIGVLLLFYRIIYGILLRRLNRNYKELKKIEIG